MKEEQNFEEIWKNAKLTKDEVIEQFKKDYPVNYHEMFIPELSTPGIPIDSKDYFDKVNELSKVIDETYPEEEMKFETKFFMMNQEDIKPLTIGTRVKHTVRNFTGIVSKYDFGSTCIVTPDNPEIKELYPFGIESKINELTILP